MRCISGHVSDIVEANALLHGQETVAYGDAGYLGVEKHPDAKADVTWYVARRPRKRKALDKNKPIDALIEKIEKLKAGVCQSGVPVSGDQAPVWICEGALSWLEEKHDTVPRCFRCLTCGLCEAN